MNKNPARSFNFKYLTPKQVPSKGYNKRKVYCSTNKTTYLSIREAAAELGLSYNLVRKCLAGLREDVKGYRFEYVD